MVQRRLTLLFTVSMLLAAMSGFSQTNPSADTIARQARFFSVSDKILMTALLTIESGNDSRERNLELALLRTATEEKMLVRITAPAFLREMKILLISSRTRNDTWIKTSQGIRRLAGSSRGEALFQSDFLTSDFRIPEGNWQFSTNIQRPGSIILQRPGGSGDDYSLERLYLRESDRLVEQREFLDREGKVTRTYIVSSWTSDSEGIRPDRIELTKPANSNRSYLQFNSDSIKKEFSENIFTPGSL